MMFSSCSQACTVRALLTLGFAALVVACSGSGSSGRVLPSGVAPDSQGRRAHAHGAGVDEFTYVANFKGSGYPGSVSAFEIDESSGALTPVAGSPFAAGVYTNGIAIDPTGKFVYVVNGGNYPSDRGSVSAYSINAHSGVLTQVAGSPFRAGRYSYAVAVDPTGKFVYAANQGSNNVSAYKINATSGALTPVASARTGQEPDAVAVDPRGKLVYVANLLSPYGDPDNVSAFKINATSGELTRVGGSPFSSGGGDPLSVAIDPTGKFAYLANLGFTRRGKGYGYDVVTYKINATSGALTWQSDSRAGAIPYSVVVDPTGSFAYVGEQFYNDVLAYKIDKHSGALKSVGEFAAGRDAGPVAIDPTSKFAYVGNYGDRTVSAYTINPSSGGLTPAAGSPFATDGAPQGIATCRRARNSCKPPPL